VTKSVPPKKKVPLQMLNLGREVTTSQQLRAAHGRGFILLQAECSVEAQPDGQHQQAQRITQEYRHGECDEDDG